MRNNSRNFSVTLANSCVFRHVFEYSWRQMLHQEACRDLSAAFHNKYPAKNHGSCISQAVKQVLIIFPKKIFKDIFNGVA